MYCAGPQARWTWSLCSAVQWAPLLLERRCLTSRECTIPLLSVCKLLNCLELRKLLLLVD